VNKEHHGVELVRCSRRNRSPSSGASPNKESVLLDRIAAATGLAGGSARACLAAATDAFLQMSSVDNQNFSDAISPKQQLECEARGRVACDATDGLRACDVLMVHGSTATFWST